MSWNSAKPRMSAAYHQPHGKTQAELLEQRTHAQSAREVRAKAAASRSPQEPGERDQEPGELSGVGRPGRAGDAETPIEDEDLIEQGVEQRHGERDSQRDDRAGRCR